MAAGSPFREWFRQTVSSLGWQRVDDLDVALAAWADVVAQCAAGYRFGLAEYDNDVSVRDALDVVWRPEADRFSEVADVRAKIHSIDAQFRSVLQPHVTIAGYGDRWWRAGIPRLGGAELVRDCADQYGVVVEPV